MVNDKTGLEEEVGDLWLSGLIGYYLDIALPMGSDDWLHLLCFMGEWGFCLSVLQYIFISIHEFSFFLPTFFPVPMWRGE